jgi:thioredoxin reductase (NADPH)
MKVFLNTILLSVLLISVGSSLGVIPIVVIGGGPAGLAAGMYGARSKFDTLVITGELPGGQLTGSGEVENWPGIIRKRGADIMDDFVEQVAGVGACFLDDIVEEVDFSESPFRIFTLENGIIEAEAVIIATGSYPRKLHVSGETRYWGSGISSCAICDCFLYTGREVGVVGGGDSAIEEVLHLVPYAKKITLFVRGSRMRAAQAMQDKLTLYPDQISIIYNVGIDEVVGDGKTVTGVLIVDRKTDIRYHYSLDGLFLAIGHTPNTKIFKHWLRLDSEGFFNLPTRSQMTEIPGVFVAGDVADKHFRQAGIAAGSGIQAALEAIDFLRYSRNDL